MPIRNLALADPEIAAAIFMDHLDQFWSNGRPERLGWGRTEVDPLHTVVMIPAKRPDGQVDPYYFRLGAEYYDAAPPTVALVEPDGVSHPPQNSKWFPVLEGGPGWFGLHHSYPFPGGVSRQLVCFTFAAEYYMTDHSPKETEVWTQGRHTVAATLNRIAEVLSPKYYRRPGG